MCSSISSSLHIDLKRCLCIHSLAQLIDVTLQSLLYQRQLIPEPASSLLSGNSQLAQRFQTTYEKVQHILRDTFRSTNGGGCIQEFVILIGGTPFSPKEIYRIRVPICNSGRTEREGGGGGCCGSGMGSCEELNAKERRLVFSAVALSKTAVTHFESCKVPGKTDKVFLFIRTRNQLTLCADGLEEDNSFELPDKELQRRRKINQLHIQVNSPCRQEKATMKNNDERKEAEEEQRRNEEEDTNKETFSTVTRNLHILFVLFYRACTTTAVNLNIKFPQS